MASSGKFITHIAALQCVQRGLITLDESVYPYLSELQHVKVLSKQLKIQSQATPITLRHLLSHSSGIVHESEPLIKAWRVIVKQEPKEVYHPCINYASLQASSDATAYDTPLLFQPGEGWAYGTSVEWTAALVARVTNVPLGQYIKENIFDPLAMTSSIYNPQDHPDICARLLQLVRRDRDQLLPVTYPLKELVSSLPDMTALLTDLLSYSSKLLKRELQDLLFVPQLSPQSEALEWIQKDTENYAAPAGIPPGMTIAPVNHSLAALTVEEKLPLSHMPAGTVTWNGMPNLIWAMHQEKGIGMMFVTQLLPVDDEKTVKLAMEFFRGAWDTFG